MSLPEFKIWVKLNYGPEAYKMEFAGSEVLIPKSLADFSREELSDLIDNVKSDIMQSMTPLTKKMEEIFRGMEG